MGRLAPQHHRIAPRQPVEPARRLHQPLRHRDVAHAVGRLGVLDEDAVGDRDRLVDVPQRARPAEARELQPRRRVALGDVARHVDAAEIERHALRARPLERREAVARLFEADPEAPRQPVDIVAQLARGGAERGIGHHERPRGVIGEARPPAAAAPRPPGRSAAATIASISSAKRGRGEAVREQEAAALRRQRGVERQRARRRSGRAGHPRRGRSRGAMPWSRQRAPSRLARRRGKRLRRAIERVDVIARLVEPVAHRLPRQPRARARGQRFLGQRQPLLRRALGGMERDQPVGDIGALLRAAAPHRCGSSGGERGIGERLAQRGQRGAPGPRPRSRRAPADNAAPAPR